MRVRGYGKKRLRKDQGSSSLEFLGTLPVAILVMLVLLQVAAAVYTTQATNQAVSDGARALSLNGQSSVAAAVEDSLPGPLSADEISYVNGGAGVRLKVRVPGIGIFPVFVVDRTAEMPPRSR